MGIKNNLLVKRAKLFFKVNQCKLFGKRAPAVAYLLITDRCNMRCRYCFVDCTTQREELTTQEWLHVIDELSFRGCAMVCFMGGEPLLHPDIDQLVDRVIARGMLCDMTTNGILVPQKLGIVKKLDSLMVSLDGDRAAQEANRGKGSFDYAVEAIRLARRYGVTVRINAVMTKQSHGCVDFLLDMADEYDVYVTFSLTAEFPVKFKDLESHVMLSDEEVKALYQKLRHERKCGRRILFSVATIDYVIDYPLAYDAIILREDTQHKKFYNKPCPFGQTMVYIDANGDFYPCATLWNGNYFTPKNIRRSSFQEAWDNAGDLVCAECFCPGVPEWNRVMSWRGIVDGVAITLRQMVSRKKK